MLKIRSLPLLTATLAFALVPASAWALTNLKKVQVTDGNQIDLLFDGKISAAQVKTEFQNDVIQLSLSGASVYPAKVNSISGADLTKVFAYQYSPNLVRCRFSVKGKAEDYQKRLQLKINGKVISVRVAAAKGDQIAASASSADRAKEEAPKETAKESAKESPKEREAAPVAAAAAPGSNLDPEEKQLLNRVLADGKDDAEKASRASGKPLATGKPLPTPFRSIGMMLFVVGLLGLFAMFLKKAKGGKLANAKGLKGFLGALGGGTKGAIDIVAQHHLGPKKSIVMVRIQDRTLVLGMTEGSISLITEFRSSEGEEEDVAESLDVADFAQGLRKFESQPSISAAAAAAASALAEPSLDFGRKAPAPGRAAASAYANAGSAPSPAGASAAGTPAFAELLRQESSKPSIRAQIRNRVEGMKKL